MSIFAYQPKAFGRAVDLVRTARPNPRTIKSASAMYKAARGILAASITFSPEQRLALARAELKALDATMLTQVQAATEAAQSMAQLERAEQRVRGLYTKELAAIRASIEEAETEVAAQGATSTP